MKILCLMLMTLRHVYIRLANINTRYLSGDLPNPGTEPMSPVSPVLAGGFLSTGPPWKSEIKEIKVPFISLPCLIALANYVCLFEQFFFS